jgi:four helix bundle protein
MNNIAEGFGRQSPKGFKNFILIARGSATETQSMISLGKSLGYFSETQAEILSRKCKRLTAMLTNFAKALKA